MNDSFPNPPIGLGPGDEYCVSPSLYAKKTYKYKPGEDDRMVLFEFKKENTNA